jgi:hypothetical protein
MVNLGGLGFAQDFEDFLEVEQIAGMVLDVVPALPRKRGFVTEGMQLTLGCGKKGKQVIA